MNNIIKEMKSVNGTILLKNFIQNLSKAISMFSFLPVNKIGKREYLALQSSPKERETGHMQGCDKNKKRKEGKNPSPGPEMHRKNTFKRTL